MKRNTINMSITVDKDLKDDARILFNKLGLSMSGAIALFLKQAVREEKIPFEISLKSNNQADGILAFQDLYYPEDVLER